MTLEKERERGSDKQFFPRGTERNYKNNLQAFLEGHVLGHEILHLAVQRCNLALELLALYLSSIVVVFQLERAKSHAKKEFHQAIVRDHCSADLHDAHLGLEGGIFCPQP